MNRKIRKMMREVERRGGTIGLSDSLPDHVAEQFLQNILDCPDCSETGNHAPGGMLSFDGPSIDKMLGGNHGRSRGRDH
ncbi:MAG TPA: hypothetical protein VEK57_13505 [Thermoanaerobaculia bacterium]|nr:hypothetical protein [Thermoanaerobaculia bacterium]